MALVVSIARDEPLCIKASADAASAWGRNEKGYGLWERGTIECDDGRTFEITLLVAVRPNANFAEFAKFPAGLEISGQLNDDDAPVGVFTVKRGKATVAIMVPALQGELESNPDEPIELDRVVLATGTGAHLRMIVSIRDCSASEAEEDDLAVEAPLLVQAEIGVAVQGTSHGAGSGGRGARTSETFIEQTTTAIVFAHGAVVRLAETVAPGQILILRHLASKAEAACRVVSVKSNAKAKSLVELDFLQPATGFWGTTLVGASAAKSGRAGVARAESTDKTSKATAIAKPVSPIHAARPEEAIVSPQSSETALSVPTGEEIPAVMPGGEELAIAHPLIEPAAATAASEVSPESEVVEDAAPAIATDSAHAAPEIVPAATADLEPSPAEAAAIETPTGATPAISVEPKIAAARPASPIASSGVVLSGGGAFAWSKHDQPKQSRAGGIAVAAAVILALAGGVGYYAWQHKIRFDAALAAPNQPILAASAPAPAPAAATASSAIPDPNAPLAGLPAAAGAQPAAPSADSSNVIAPAAKTQAITRSAQPAVNPQPSGAKPLAVAPADSTPQFVSGPEFGEMRMPAPAAADRSTDQTTPDIAAKVPSGVPDASTRAILSDAAQSERPPMPPPVDSSSGAQQPRLLWSSAPIYPDAARAEKVQGDVSVDLTIDETGKVAGMTVLSGPKPLRQAALDALRHRQYLPAMVDGTPTTTHIVVTLHFEP